MSGLFLAATRDSQPWPSYAPGFLNIQLECGEVVAVFVRKEAYVYMCSWQRERVWQKERESGRCQYRHHDPSHLGTANWQLISRIDSVVRSRVPAPLPSPPARQVHLIWLLSWCCNNNPILSVLEGAEQHLEEHFLGGYWRGERRPLVVVAGFIYAFQFVEQLLQIQNSALGTIWTHAALVAVNSHGSLKQLMLMCAATFMCGPHRI